MEDMAEDSEENYNKHFSQFIAANIEGSGLEDKYKEVRALLQTPTYPTAAYAPAFACCARTPWSLHACFEGQHEADVGKKPTACQDMSIAPICLGAV